MSYFTAQPFNSGPPGPLRVTPALGGSDPCVMCRKVGVGDIFGAATNFRAAQCPCTPVGADDVREGSTFNALAVAAVMVGGFLFLARKATRKR